MLSLTKQRSNRIDIYEIFENHFTRGRYYVVWDHDVDIDGSEESAQEVCSSDCNVCRDLSVKRIDNNLWFALIAFFVHFFCYQVSSIWEKLLAVAD